LVVLALGLAGVVVLPGAQAHDPVPKETPKDASGGSGPGPIQGTPGVHAHSDKTQDHDHAGDAAHAHAPVPPEYRSAHVPAAAWVDARLIARGKEIYGTRCAVCHGDAGDGKGPAGVALPLKPPDLRDPKMIGEMAGNYWFWRISEGGAVEPFQSLGSTMPAWKNDLSVEDRWAVIAYQHTFSGHAGPHVTSEHPEMVAPAHASHDSPATAAPSSSGGHKH
jgi:mono/diheme cytochrome c family protein